MIANGGLDVVVVLAMRLGRLRAAHRAVVDCVYGCEKEDDEEEEACEIEGNRRQEGDVDEEAA